MPSSVTVISRDEFERRRHPLEDSDVPDQPRHPSNSRRGKWPSPRKRRARFPKKRTKDQTEADAHANDVDEARPGQGGEQLHNVDEEGLGTTCTPAHGLPPKPPPQSLARPLPARPDSPLISHEHLPARPDWATAPTGDRRRRRNYSSTVPGKTYARIVGAQQEDVALHSTPTSNPSTHTSTTHPTSTDATATATATTSTTATSTSTFACASSSTSAQPSAPSNISNTPSPAPSSPKPSTPRLTPRSTPRPTPRSTPRPTPLPTPRPIPPPIPLPILGRIPDLTDAQALAHHPGVLALAGLAPMVEYWALRVYLSMEGVCEIGHMESNAALKVATLVHIFLGVGPSIYLGNQKPPRLGGLTVPALFWSDEDAFRDAAGCLADVLAGTYWAEEVDVGEEEGQHQSQGQGSDPDGERAEVEQVIAAPSDSRHTVSCAAISDASPDTPQARTYRQPRPRGGAYVQPSTFPASRSRATSHPLSHSHTPLPTPAERLASRRNAALYLILYDTSMLRASLADSFVGLLPMKMGFEGRHAHVRHLRRAKHLSQWPPDSAFCGPASGGRVVRFRR